MLDPFFHQVKLRSLLVAYHFLKIRPLLRIWIWLHKITSENLNPCVWGRKEKDFIRVFPDLSFCIYFNTKIPLHSFTNITEKQRKEHSASTLHISRELIRFFFYITPSDLSTHIGKWLSFFQQVCSASLISEYQRLMSNINQIVTLSKKWTQECAILNLLPYFNFKAVSLLHNNFSCLSIEHL